MFEVDPGWFQIDPWLIAIIGIGVAAFFALAIIWGIRAHHREISAGREELIGKIAEVKTVMNPKGTVFTQGELWTAMSEEGRLEPGEEVVITKIDRLRLWVARKTTTQKR